MFPVNSQSPAARRSRGRSAFVHLLGVVVLVGAVAAPATGATDWSRQKVSTSKRLLDVAFVDASNGVSVGQGGTILVTGDGGVTWNPPPTSLTTADLRVIVGLPNCGDNGAGCYWAGTADGKVLVSKTSGNEWCLQETGVTARITGLAVTPNAGEVVAVGSAGTIIRSANAKECGSSAAYGVQPSGVSKNLAAVTMAPDNSTVAVGAGGTVLRQAGSGPWEVVNSGTVSNLDGVTVARGLGTNYTLWAVGEAGTILTNPNGSGWSARPSGVRFDLHDVSFPNGLQTGFAVGDLGTIVGTADGGASWKVQTSSTCNNLFGISMIDPDRGWVVGGSGTVVIKPASGKGTQPRCARTGAGYWLVASDGGIFSFGDAAFQGSTGSLRLNRPIVGMAATPSGTGYWLVASDGGIFSFGDAAFLGSTGNLRLNRPIVGMAATPSGTGYWLVASDGGIFAFGDAAFHGSTGDLKLVSPIVGMATTPSGAGYWLVAQDGGIFAFGDAKFQGSAAGKPRSSPVVGMASTPTGLGYWLTTADGAVLTFGDAKSHGAANAKPLSRPIMSMSATPTGAGYWLVASDGGIFAFGDASFFGSTGAMRLNQPIVGMANS
jgi:photosystem II stability/assembly factor-like uncharacterized protein/ribosomal protein L24E